MISRVDQRSRRGRPTRIGRGGSSGGAAAATMSDVILALGPVSYWPMRETSGNFLDLGSLNNPVSTITNITRAAVAGGDLGFSYPSNATTQPTAQAADDAAYSCNTSGVGLTIGCLIRRTTISSQKYFISKYGVSGQREYYFQSGPFGGAEEVGVTTTVATGGAARDSYTNDTNPAPTNTWVPVIARFGHGVTDRPTLRVNGPQATTFLSTSTAFQNGTTPFTLFSNGSNGQYWEGAMGHVFVIPRQITDGECEEIEAAFTAGQW